MPIETFVREPSKFDPLAQIVIDRMKLEVQVPKRKGWDEYFLDMADLVATRATCLRAKHGTVLVRDHRVISCGYNGSLPGEAHCLDAGCERVNGHCVRTVHSEPNALYNVNAIGATAYITANPCSLCLKALKAARVAVIIYRNIYLDGQLTPLDYPRAEYLCST